MNQGLPLQIAKGVNDLSQTMIDLYTPLEPGQKVRVRLLQSTQDYTDKQVYFGSSKSWSFNDRILDIGTKRLVKIGVIKDEGNEKEPMTFKRKFLGMDGSVVSQEFELNGDILDDQEEHCFLFYSNDRADNPNRDKSRTAIYEFVNQEKDAKKKLKPNDSLRLALNYVADMKVGDMIRFSEARNWLAETSPYVLRAKITDLAKSAPDEFMKKAKDPLEVYRQVTKLGIDNGIIAWNPITRKITWPESEEVIATLPQEAKKNHLDLMAEWVVANPRGLMVFNEIQSQLDDKLATEKYGRLLEAEQIEEDNEDGLVTVGDEPKAEKKKGGRPPKVTAEV